MLKASSDHLDEVQEGYFEHLGAALGYSAMLAKAAAGCLVHAIVPGLCTRSVSGCVARISSDLGAGAGAGLVLLGSGAQGPLDRLG